MSTRFWLYKFHPSMENTACPTGKPPYPGTPKGRMTGNSGLGKLIFPIRIKGQQAVAVGCVPSVFAMGAILNFNLTFVKPQMARAASRAASGPALW